MGLKVYATKPAPILCPPPLDTSFLTGPWAGSSPDLEVEDELALPLPHTHLPSILELSVLSHISHHIHKGHVEEDPSRDPKHPGGEGDRAQAEPHPEGCTPQSQGSRNEAQQQQPPEGQPCLKEHRKVTCWGQDRRVSRAAPPRRSPFCPTCPALAIPTQFMGQLVAEDC